jgi:hypothetical protein
VVEVADIAERIEAIMPKIDEMAREGMVTLSGSRSSPIGPSRRGAIRAPDYDWWLREPLHVRH